MQDPQLSNLERDERCVLDETDLALIDALKLNARASWKVIGSALGVNPATAARRWQRLNEGREAWITAQLGSPQTRLMCTAFLEIACESGSAIDVASRLADEPHVITVQLIAGDYDIFAVAIAPSFAAMSQYILHELPKYDGVARTRANFATRVFESRVTQPLGVLSPGQIHWLRAAAPNGPGPGDQEELTRADRDLFIALSADGRRTFIDLERTLGASRRVVERRLNRLVARGDITFRCDLARGLAGWNTAAVIGLTVPDERIEEVAQELLLWPETRTCAAMADRRNLLLILGLHFVSDLHEFVTRIRTRFPSASVEERAVVMRQLKLYGRRVDASGRCTASVPLDFWRSRLHCPNAIG